MTGKQSSEDADSARARIPFDSVRDAWVMGRFDSKLSNMQRHGRIVHALRLGMQDGDPSYAETTLELLQVVTPVYLRVSLSPTREPDVYKMWDSLPKGMRSDWFHAYIKRGLRKQMAAEGKPASVTAPAHANRDDLPVAAMPAKSAETPALLSDKAVVSSNESGNIVFPENFEGVDDDAAYDGVRSLLESCM
jgi:hypothetical protein